MSELSRDAVRQKILRRLYALHESGAESELRDVFVVQFLQANPRATEAQVLSNLRYLALKGWALRDSAGEVALSAEGIDLLEGATGHQLPKARDHPDVRGADDYAFIGDGDLVLAGREELYRALGSLRERIARSRRLTRAEKIDAAADIKALQSLLQKSKPDKRVVESLWASAREAAKRAELEEEVARADGAKGVLDS